MGDDRTIQTTFWIMVVLQTVGSVDMPGKGDRKMPAPRAYVAVVALWSILSLMAGTGAGRVAARLSILLVLTGAVIGPFAGKAVSLLNGIASAFAIAPPTSSSSSSSATTPPTSSSGTTTPKTVTA